MTETLLSCADSMPRPSQSLTAAAASPPFRTQTMISLGAQNSASLLTYQQPNVPAPRSPSRQQHIAQLLKPHTGAGTAASAAAAAAAAAVAKIALIAAAPAAAASAAAAVPTAAAPAMLVAQCLHPHPCPHPLLLLLLVVQRPSSMRFS